MSDPKNTQGTPGADEEADTASGGAPDDGGSTADSGSTGDGGSDDTDEVLEEETTDDDGAPLENPSGG